MRRLVACVLLAVLVWPPAAGVAAAGPREGQSKQQARQAQSKYTQATGTVVGVRGKILTIRTEKGGTASYRLEEGTAVDAGGRGALRPGTRVQVWAIKVGEGPPVAVRVQVLGSRQAARAPRAAGEEMVGLVLAHTGRMIRLLDERDAVLTVLVTGTTMLPPTSLPRGAIVEVRGSRNSDGTVAAGVVTLRFDPRGAYRASGRIASLLSGGSFILANGTAVRVEGATWIFRGSALRPARALTPGVEVTVYGRGKPPLIAAQVIEITP